MKVLDMLDKTLKPPSRDFERTMRAFTHLLNAFHITSIDTKAPYDELREGLKDKRKILFAILKLKEMVDSNEFVNGPLQTIRDIYLNRITAIVNKSTTESPIIKVGRLVVCVIKYIDSKGQSLLATSVSMPGIEDRAYSSVGKSNSCLHLLSPTTSIQKKGLRSSLDC